MRSILHRALLFGGQTLSRPFIFPLFCRFISAAFPPAEVCWVICRLTSTTQQRQEGREYRRDKEMQSGVGTLGSLGEQGKKSYVKSCDLIRVGGGRTGTEEVKLWRIRNGGAHREMRRN